MKFELKFDENIYRNQMDLLRDLAWKDKIAYYKNSHFLGIILLIIGSLLFFDRPSFFGFVLIIFGLGILIPYFYYYFKIKSSYKGFEEVKTKEIEACQNIATFTWEFTEQGLISKVQDNERMLEWKEFITYLIKENNLFLITEKYEPMILGETEVGEENFKKILDFVEKRVTEKK
ncbi:hypothetical protein [Flavobacterium aquicola]|uniref:YcxB-like protein n=1 Tax=Flavobacterium aquicola TaxID=1682742 RepID=A0A3E0ENS4_9FLAO|nr:hypothetical protein [Flavobacterium aquicola]REG98999.1 hypothetical protein C8P67_105164 [Flavobacterium aquicola]